MKIFTKQNIIITFLISINIMFSSSIFASEISLEQTLKYITGNDPIAWHDIINTEEERITIRSHLIELYNNPELVQKFSIANPEAIKFLALGLLGKFAVNEEGDLDPIVLAFYKKVKKELPRENYNFIHFIRSCSDAQTPETISWLLDYNDGTKSWENRYLMKKIGKAFETRTTPKTNRAILQRKGLSDASKRTVTPQAYKTLEERKYPEKWEELKKRHKEALKKLKRI